MVLVNPRSAVYLVSNSPKTVSTLLAISVGIFPFSTVIDNLMSLSGNISAVLYTEYVTSKNG